MIAEGSQYIVNDPWMIVPPGILVVLVILAFGLLGDGVRDSYTEMWSSASRSTARTARKPLKSQLHNITDDMKESNTFSVSVLLDVRNLSISIAQNDGEAPVTSDVSFSVDSGEALGIVGESGCGKTMTGHAIIGLLPKGRESPRGRYGSRARVFVAPVKENASSSWTRNCDGFARTGGKFGSCVSHWCSDCRGSTCLQRYHSRRSQEGSA